jgi:hypothetical protein
MIDVVFDDKKFMKQMNNLIAYAGGFIDGAISAKPQLLESIGERVQDLLGNYIDAIAGANPSMLHHVYEWAQTGSSTARLFDINYSISNGGLSMNATLSQSMSVKAGSNVPFYNKARIMEQGNSVTITPKDGGVLAFNDNGEQVFTKKPVVVLKPGGEAVEGQFEDTFNDYFSIYLSQALFSAVGLDYKLSNPVQFKENLQRGVASGRSVGISAGKKWITGGNQ